MGRMDPGMHGEVDFYLGLAEQLKLDEAQLARLRSQKFAFDKARVKQGALLQTAEIELQELRCVEPVDVGKVEAKIREVFAKRGEEAVAAFAAQVDADKVLTEVQRAQVHHPGPPRMHRGGNPGEARPEAK
jgi:Spy/CpxP family protein refolding chaperone